MTKEENLFCIPYQKAMPLRQKTGIYYHCQRNEDEKKLLPKMCNECKKRFKDNRCLKIHQTKMNHPPNVSKKRNAARSNLGSQDSSKKSRDK